MQQSNDAASQMVDSESQQLAERHSDLATAQQSWNDEKQSLLASVESLKKLLALIQARSSVIYKKSIYSNNH